MAAAAAAMWCGLFACLHLFWALGGSIGLASSAGHDLAERRPVSFVIFGLFGVALCLHLGIAVIAITQSARIARRWRHAAAVLLAVVGVGLAIRVWPWNYFSLRTPVGCGRALGPWRLTGALSSGTHGSLSEVRSSS